MKTQIHNYPGPDGLAILIRKSGGWAFVERVNGHDVVFCNRSRAWVNRLCQANQWITT